MLTAIIHSFQNKAHDLWKSHSEGSAGGGEERKRAKTDLANERNWSWTAPGHPSPKLLIGCLLFGIEKPDGSSRSLSSSSNSIPISAIWTRSRDNCPDVLLHQRSHCTCSPRRLTSTSAYPRWGRRMTLRKMVSSSENSSASFKREGSSTALSKRETSDHLLSPASSAWASWRVGPWDLLAMARAWHLPCDVNNINHRKSL